MKNVKELWAEYARTQKRDILVRIGEIARAEQIRQAQQLKEVNHFEMAASSKRTLRGRRYSRTVGAIKTNM